MSVSDIEISRGGDSFMFETLEELQRVRPGSYWLILGTDAVAGLPSWRQPDRIVRIARIALLPRPGYDLSTVMSRLPTDLTAVIDLVEARPVSISSSIIREAVFRGEDVSRFVKPEVAKYIEENSLYKD